jgi:hypothetical protein
MGRRQRRQFLLPVEIPLAAESPEQGDGSRLPTLQLSQDHAAEGAIPVPVATNNRSLAPSSRR